MIVPPDGADLSMKYGLKYGLTEEQLAECTEVFELWAHRTGKAQNGEPVLRTADLHRLVLSLGAKPTDAELREMIAEVDTDGWMFFEAFIRLFARLLAEMNDDADEMKEVFRVFDEDNDGLITTAELRLLMTQMGEDTTNEEVDTAIAELTVGELVDYHAFTQVAL